MTNENYYSRRDFIQTTALALPLLAAGCAGLETDDEQSRRTAQMTSLTTDARRVIIKATGFAPFSASFAATVEIAGERLVLSSMTGVVNKVSVSTEKTPYGRAAITTSTIHFDQAGLDLMLRFGEVSGVPAALFQAGIRNRRATAINLWALTQLATDAKASDVPDAGLKCEGNPEDWLVTRLTGNFDGEARLLNSIVEPLEIEERGGIYRRDGAGFLFAPVGVPIAYLDSHVTCESNGRVSFQMAANMSGVRVDPGETRWGQQAALLMEKPNIACARQAAWVAQTHQARTRKGALDGWCSWYLLDKHVTGKDVLGIVDAVLNNPQQLHPSAIQIDDGYQNYDGIWDANEKFPEGMPYYAKRIAETGARPGLWMALTLIGKHAPWLNDPANLEAVWEQKFKKESEYRPDESGWLDPSHPRAKAHIADRVRHAVNNGYTYLKLDFNDIGVASHGWYEKKRTSFEIMRDLYTMVRQTAGEDIYIMFCTPSPVRAVVGLVDSSRTSMDAHRGGLRLSIDQVLRSFDLNGRWFAVDNDCYYLATELKGVGDVQGGWPILKTYSSIMGLSCGAAFTSDMWNWEVYKPYLRNTEIMTPPAKERTEILDLGVSENWPRLVSHVSRPWGNWTVALLWNPAQQAESVTLDFAQCGLDPTHRYAVWSFWDDCFLGIAEGQWTTPVLPPSGSQHLCLTDLDKQSGQPVFIGSNLHILCGAAEINKFCATAAAIDIELTDAGAREGDLFVWSAKPLTLKSAAGCKVDSVGTTTMENVWKIYVAGRKRGIPQTIRLGIMA